MNSKEINHFNKALVSYVYTENLAISEVEPECRVVLALSDSLESVLLMQIVFCIAAIFVYLGVQSKSSSIDSNKARKFALVGLVASIGMCVFASLKAMKERDCPDQLGPWVFANSVISILAILNIELSHFVFNQHLRAVICKIVQD